MQVCDRVSTSECLGAGCGLDILSRAWGDMNNCVIVRAGSSHVWHMCAVAACRRGSLACDAE